jgi:hypothetical protein
LLRLAIETIEPPRSLVIVAEPIERRRAAMLVTSHSGQDPDPDSAVPQQPQRVT